MTDQGVGSRLDTYIDIPLEMRLPHFISDDCGHDEEGFEPNFTNFKLSLLSVICHRGSSLDAGHYISLVRGETANVSPGSTVHMQATQPQAAQAAHNTQTPQPSETTTSLEAIKAAQGASNQPRPPTTNYTQEEPQSDSNGIPKEVKRPPQEPFWLRCDDLAKERVSPVDIHQALKDEAPYLLFYQVLPIEDDPISESEQGDPPPYEEVLVETNDELSRITTRSATTELSTTTSIVDTILPPRDSFLQTSDATIATYEVGANNLSLLLVDKKGLANIRVDPLRHSSSDPLLPSPVMGEHPKLDPPMDATRPKSIDLSHIALTSPNLVVRSSMDEARGRNSMHSTRGSLTFTEASVNGSHKTSSSTPITPGDETETKNGFLSVSRRNSINKGWLKTKPRPSSQSGETKLSASISRLRSHISKDKLATTALPLPVENGVVNFPDGSPERRGDTTLHLESADAGNTHRKSGSFGRSKSLRRLTGKGENRKSKGFGKDIENGTEVLKADRECVVM